MVAKVAKVANYKQKIVKSLFEDVTRYLQENLLMILKFACSPSLVRHFGGEQPTTLGAKTFATYGGEGSEGEANKY